MYLLSAFRWNNLQFYGTTGIYGQQKYLLKYYTIKYKDTNLLEEVHIKCTGFILQCLPQVIYHHLIYYSPLYETQNPSWCFHSTLFLTMKLHDFNIARSVVHSCNYIMTNASWASDRVNLVNSYSENDEAAASSASMLPMLMLRLTTCMVKFIYFFLFSSWGRGSLGPRLSPPPFPLPMIWAVNTAKRLLFLTSQRKYVCWKVMLGRKVASAVLALMDSMYK